MTKDLEAVTYILNSFFEALQNTEKEKPELFYSDKFSQWAMLAGLNYLCQLSVINRMDLDFLITNLTSVWGAIQKGGSTTLN